MTSIENIPDSPIKSFAKQVTNSVAGPLYTMPEMRGTPYAALDAIYTGKDMMPQMGTTPWNPNTQQSMSVLANLTRTTFQKMYESVAANKILTEVVPLVEADPNSNQIEWYTVLFDPALMDEIPELSLGREIGFQRTARVAKIRTYKIGYTFSNDILRHSDGLKIVANYIAHISNIQMDTAVGVALDALLRAEDIYRQKLRDSYEVQPRSLHEVFADEIGYFDILHHDQGVGLLRDHLAKVFSIQQGGAYRYLLLTEDIANQMRRMPSETEYYRAGPPAVANRTFSTPLVPAATIPTPPGFQEAETVLLKTNYTARMVPENGMGILQQVVQIGEFYLMRHQANSNADKDARSNNIKIYDGQTDCYEMIDFMQGVDEARIFDSMGNPRHLTDAGYLQSAVVKGNIVDVIWDSNGRARYTHGQIPRDYLPRNHASEFASAVAKILQSRHIAIDQYKDLAKLVAKVKVAANTTFAATKITGDIGSTILPIKGVTGDAGGKTDQKQGVSFDDLERTDQDIVANFVNSIMDFFPHNAFLNAGSAPLWSANQTAAASLWENMLLPYYPPILLVDAGAGPQSDMLKTLGADLAKHGKILKLLVEAWASTGGENAKYRALITSSGAGDLDKLADSQEFQAKLASEIKKLQTRFSDQQKAAYGKLIQVYELLKQQGGGSIAFTTLRQTPGLDISGLAKLRYVDPNMPLVPIEQAKAKEMGLASAFHVNQALKHHIRAIQSDSVGAYLAKVPGGLIGEVYRQGVQHQETLRQTLGARYSIPTGGAENIEIETRDFIPYARRASSAMGMLGALFEGEFICRQSWERWASEGLPMPVAVMIVRPTIDVLTATLIACRGGRDAGGLYYKPSAERTGSHVRGQVQSQVQCQFAGVINMPETVRVVRNAMVLNVIRGHNTKFFAPESFKNGPGAWNKNASMLAFIVPANMRREMISLTGSFDHPGVHNYRDMHYHSGDGGWVGSDRANTMYDFKKIAAQRRRNNAEHFDRFNVNVLCFPGQTWNFNAATQTFDIMSPGTGHFKNTCTIGAAETRGHRRYAYPPLPQSV